MQVQPARSRLNLERHTRAGCRQILQQINAGMTSMDAAASRENRLQRFLRCLLQMEGAQIELPGALENSRPREVALGRSHPPRSLVAHAAVCAGARDWTSYGTGDAAVSVRRARPAGTSR
jgi:hypothetical protein